MWLVCPTRQMRKVTSSTWLNEVQPPHGHTQGWQSNIETGGRLWRWETAQMTPDTLFGPLVSVLVFFPFIFIDSNACFFAYTASNLHTTRYGDRQKSTTMGNGPNDNRHVVWALGARFQPFLNNLPRFWLIFLTFRAPFTCLDAFSNTVNHLWPLQHVFQSFPTFLCPHIIPQLPQPFPNPCSHFPPLSLISMCFWPISTDLGSHDKPTHLYDLPWPFLSPTVHFWSHTLIPDPKPHFQPFLHFPNRYHVFLRVYEFGQPPTSTWTRSKVSTHIFETVHLRALIHTHTHP